MRAAARQRWRCGAPCTEHAIRTRKPWFTHAPRCMHSTAIECTLFADRRSHWTTLVESRHTSHEHTGTRRARVSRLAGTEISSPRSMWMEQRFHSARPSPRAPPKATRRLTQTPPPHLRPSPEIIIMLLSLNAEKPCPRTLVESDAGGHGAIAIHRMVGVAPRPRAGCEPDVGQRSPTSADGLYSTPSSRGLSSRQHGRVPAARRWRRRAGTRCPPSRAD